MDTPLATAGESILAVYFPITAITSTVVDLPESECIEVGLMGAEGVTGLSLLYGESIARSTVIVQIPGEATRMSADDFQREVVTRDGAPLRLFLHYANAFARAVAVVAACNVSHSVEQRFARWLLLVHDRVMRDEFPVTYDFATRMLGVRRSDVTEATKALAGAVDYVDAHIVVRDRALLLKASCGCYASIRKTLESVFELGAASTSYQN
jgi:CRP-like cAMP-binding protein